MLSQNKIKYLISLQSKKNRENLNVFIAEGDKICQEIVASEKLKIENIFATEKWIDSNQEILQKHRNLLVEISENELKKISSLSTPNQVLISAFKPNFLIEKNTLQDDIVLYLDGIQDPGNMGTILRNADWFGIAHVFCSDTCVDIYNSKVIQASMGAFLRIKSQEIDLQELISHFEEINVYGTHLEGENIYEQKLSPNGIIVIGSEGKGINEQNLSLITQKIKIPSYGKGAESLNAAVATGIVCSIFRNKL
jgi:RNA methyltransferase, TrmH family